MKAIIAKRYESSEHLDYPEMKRLIDHVIENPNDKFTIPKKFLVKKQHNLSSIDTLVHKIKVFVRSIWLNLKKTFDEDYRKRFELAVKKIIHAYEATTKVVKTAEETLPPQKSHDAIPQEKITREQQNVELAVKQQIERTSDQQEPLNSEKVLTPPEKGEDSVTVIKQEKKPSKEKKEPQVNIPIQDRQEDSQKDNQVGSKDTCAQITETKRVQKVERKRVENAPAVKSNYAVMYNDLKFKTENSDLATLWKTLLGNVTNIDSLMTKWSCNSHGCFIIRLKKPLHLWIDTDRVGGCVFSFASTIRGSLEKDKILFDSGFTSYCMHNIWLAYKRVEPVMNNIHFINRNRIQMSGTFWKMTNIAEFSYTNLLEEWSQKVEVIPDDYRGGYKEYLEAKFREQK